MGAAPGSVSNPEGEQEKVSARYHIQKVKLGAGSFGTVWRAVDRKTGDTVAMKQLDKSKMGMRKVKRQDVEREVQLLRTCQHESITRLCAFFEDKQFIYLALEYCGDGDLADKLKERSARLGDADVSSWMHQICSAICELHSKGICHRDIKPDNFLVSGNLLKLADFGLAMFLPRGSLLKDKCGTPAFMAPELHALPSQSHGYGLPVDMWAAGVTMFMLMSEGKHPFIDRGSQKLDMHRLMQGSLDFTVGPERDLADQVGEFFGFAAERETDARFSDAARHICQAMVQVGPSQRITAEGALRYPWLAAARRPSHVQQAPVHSSTSSNQQSPPLRQSAQPANVASASSTGSSPGRSSPPMATAGSSSSLRSPPLMASAGISAPMQPSTELLTDTKPDVGAPGPPDSSIHGSPSSAAAPAVLPPAPAVPRDEAARPYSGDSGPSSVVQLQRSLAVARQQIAEHQIRISDLQGQLTAARTEQSRLASLVSAREAELHHCAAKLAKSQMDGDADFANHATNLASLEAREIALELREGEIIRRCEQLNEAQRKLEEKSSQLSQQQLSQQNRRRIWPCCRARRRCQNHKHDSMQSSV